MHVTTPASVPADRRAATLVMACLGVFIAYLPLTTVSVSLPAIQSALRASTTQLPWIQDAFVLPMAAFILAAGAVGDIHGRKKVFQAGLLLSAAGAATALSARSIEVLWTGQALAGLGAAALLPTTLALISHAVPDPRERGKYIGRWATSFLAALALGPLVAGVLLDHVSWRWIYLLPIPLSLVVMALAARLLTDSRAPRGRRLDWPGQITATAAITALVYGVIEGGAVSFLHTEAIVALCVAVAGGVAFVLVERRSDSPMLDLALFRSPAFTATTLVATTAFLAVIGFFFVLSLYLGMVQQLDTLQAGLRLLLINLAAILAGGAAGRHMHRISPRVMITGGLLVVTGALLSLTSLDAETSLASAGWRLVLLGLGMGFVVTPMTATAVASVPHHLAGMASAGNNAFRQLGGALGPAVLGTLLTSRAEHTLPAHLADAGVSGTVRQHTVAAVEAEGLGAVARLDLGADTGRALAAAGDAFLDGLRLCLIVAAVLTLLAAAVSAVLLGRQRQNGAASVKVTTATSGAATPIGVVTAPDVAAIGQGDGGS
ncbi:MFS transporter [Streptomyces caniscabiei]|nr:MFS transporter [Streptomyces caniscabiei]MDX3513909.1 MFS transporter [Streptomyces caniscabiei]MDX3722911.1 MFS transporter [Streptomyces caniscabiei]MDX3731457.1 MFS transporter [Streptomyces caniscabiei]WEO23561.1 MFS transporter [Streptomyces caniscabiei]